jgi:hypothetical protein
VSTEVQFGTPGPGRQGRARISHAIVAAQLRERPGQWALVDVRSTSRLAASGASNIRHAFNLRYYEPAGSFEARAVAERAEGGHIEYQVWARYIGEAKTDE